MNSFLFIGDYAKLIQADALTSIIGGKSQILEGIQRAAVEECISYLKQKYDTELEFEDTTPHNRSLSYLAENTLYLDAIAYNATMTYALNTYTLQLGNVYQCSTVISTPEAFTSAHWTLLGLQYDLFYGILPSPTFNYQLIYKKTDIVFWKNNQYTALLPTQIIDHGTLLQANQANRSNILNIFPDDPVYGLQYWGTPRPYTIAANTSLTNTTYWHVGDNRDQKLLMVCVDIAMYHAHARISPRNIPDIRVHRYIGDVQDRHAKGQTITFPTYCALGWLQAASIGDDITPELPTLQPVRGNRVRYGGNFKNINSF